MMTNPTQHLEEAIAKCTNYDEALKVAREIVDLTQPAIESDQIWTNWETLLLAGLVLHCALNPETKPSLVRIQEFLTSPETARDAIMSCLQGDAEKQALHKFEQALDLVPSKEGSHKNQTLINSRWSGAIAGISKRVNKLLSGKPDQ